MSAHINILIAAVFL